MSNLRTDFILARSQQIAKEYAIKIGLKEFGYISDQHHLFGIDQGHLHLVDDWWRIPHAYEICAYADRRDIRIITYAKDAKLLLPWSMLRKHADFANLKNQGDQLYYMMRIGVDPDLKMSTDSLIEGIIKFKKGNKEFSASTIHKMWVVRIGESTLDPDHKYPPDNERYIGQGKSLNEALHDLVRNMAELNNNSSGRDWSEDFKQENGNYQNTCSFCKCEFLGNKHRRICKLCSPKDSKLPTGFKFKLM